MIVKLGELKVRAVRRRITLRNTLERIQRLTELTEELIEHAEGIQERFEAADAVKRQLYDLVAALGRTAEVVAREHADAIEEAPVPK